jgi:hypothetical protein
MGSEASLTTTTDDSDTAVYPGQQHLVAHADGRELDLTDLSDVGCLGFLASVAATRVTMDPNGSRALLNASIDLAIAADVWFLRTQIATTGRCPQCRHEYPTSPRCFSCEQEVTAEYEAERPPVHHCGVPTKTTGRPCQSSVDLPGTRCRRHREATG